jgi:hypothetical protein
MAGEWETIWNERRCNPAVQTCWRVRPKSVRNVRAVRFQNILGFHSGGCCETFEYNLTENVSANVKYLFFGYYMSAVPVERGPSPGTVLREMVNDTLAGIAG